MKIKKILKLNIPKILKLESNLQNSFSPTNASKTTSKNIIKILPKLYLSNYDGVSNKKILEKKNISIIFNLTKKNCKSLYSKNFHYENYEIKDDGKINIKFLLKKIIKKIHSYIKKNKNVVIHCYKGISRAPTIVIAYLMEIYGRSYEDAFDYVKMKSDDIDPNAGFLVQLMDFKA